MATSLQYLAQLAGGEARGTAEIHGAAALCDVQAGQITFIDRPEKIARLQGTPAAAAVVPRGCRAAQLPVIEVENVHEAFAKIFTHFHPPRPCAAVGVSPAAFVSPSARLGRDVQVHPGATIGDDVELGDRTVVHSGARLLAGCRVGEDVVIHPNAVLMEGTVVGPRSIIHACAVLGADGFGYTLHQGRYQRAPQLGYVEIGADVEIGPGTTIDRGTFGPTRIGEGTKIDDQVMIAHNCRIGRHNILCSQVGIAGSVTTGDYVVMAGQVGIRDHVTIGDQAMLGAMSGVMNDVPAGARCVGIPATPEREQMIKQAALSKLPEMRRQLRELQEQVRRLTAARDTRGGSNGDSQAA